MIGDRFKSERERLAKTQEEVGSLLGASKRTVIDWEKSRTSATGQQFEVLALAGFDVLYVITGQRSAPVAPADPGEQVLLAAYRAAPVAQRAAMLGAVVGIAGGAGMAGPADVLPKAKKVKLGDGAVMVGSAGGSVNIRR